MAVVKNLMVRSGADFSALYKEMNKSQQKISAWQKSIGKTLKGLGAILGGIAAGKIAKDFVTTAMRTEVLDVAMRSVAKSSGYAIQALQEHRKAVMEMGIAEQEATQILTRFMQAQLDTAYAAKVARVAQDAAVIANMNSSEAAEQMTEAIAKLRPELLSAFGFTRNLNDIYSDYAKTVGKTVKQLSETEKKQAMLNYILKEGEKIAGTYEASMGVVGKQISSLPRYYDTLKNAIAKPLALPAVGVAVEAITNTLKSAIAWAEANKETLQRWGQTISNVLRSAVKGLKMVTGAIVENWQAIKFAGTTLLTYIFITKGAAAATTAWRIATLTLKGELMQKIPVLTAVSTAIGTYRLQMALAPAATNIFIAALLRLRAALYAVHTALGPIGWAVLGISALVSGGMSLWSKYNQSLQKTASLGFGDFRTAQDGLTKSTGAAADASEGQADAIEKAGKAAKKSLAGFDEIHQLQKDMAEGGSEAGEGLLDELDLGGIGGGIPGLDMGDMLGEIEQMKPTLKGFWEWIKQGAGNLWDGVKVKWVGFKDWTASWAGPLWDKVKVKWGGFKGWAGNLWDGTKEKWGGFTDWVGNKWDGFKTKSKEIWGGVKTNVQTKWEELKTDAPIVWEGIKTNIETRWNTLSTGAKSTWANIKDTAQTSWNTLKKDAPTAWENVKKTIETKTKNTQETTAKIWGEITKSMSDTWSGIKITADTSWTEIKTTLGTKWGKIKESGETTFETLKKNLTSKWGNTKTEADTAWGKIKTAIENPIEKAKTTVLNIIEDIKTAFSNMKITIPKPKLPHISVSTKTKKIGNISIPYPDFDINWYAQGAVFSGPSVIGVGEAGAEAVLPLERNTGWMDTLAAKIAAAIPGGQAGGDIYVYVGNEQVDAYVYRSQDRRNVKSNGR